MSNIFSHPDRNISLLLRYNFFMSLTLAVLANFQLQDRLLLRMGFEAERFGAIKSMMFLAPALIYQLALPLLHRADPVRLCVNSYALRTILPCLLPFFAIVCTDLNTLEIVTMAVFAICYTAAAFANNTLAVIYRHSLPARQFNELTAKIFLYFNLPLLVVVFPVAWIFTLVEWLPRPWFLLVFGVTQVVSVLFELPAIKALRQLKLADYSGGTKPPRFREMIRPLFNPAYRRFLGFAALRSFLAGMLGAFFFVYLYTERNWTTFDAVLWGTLLAGAGLVISLPFGRLADHIGYPASFLILNLLLVVGTGILGFGAASPWLMALVVILVWDGSGSIVAQIANAIEQGAAGRLAGKKHTPCYISLFNFAYMIARAAGSVAAGWLLKLVSTPEHGYNFIGFFQLCFFTAALLLIYSLGWLLREPRPITHS